jgi:hypothetical protein
MLFLDNWCSYTKELDNVNIYVHSTVADVELAQATPVSVMAAQATKKLAEYLGSKPAFCLSGGIDSQAAYQLWDKQYPIDVIIFEFSNELNSDEVRDAVHYAKTYGIDYKIVTLDVERFLSFNLIDFARQHCLLSPQFATHAFFLDHLKKLGYTGAVFGGNGFLIQESKVDFNASTPQFLDIENYGRSGFNVISNFLGVDQNICLKLALNTSKIPDFDTTYLNGAVPPDVYKEKYEEHKKNRYQNKINSYRNLGLKIIPQEEKKHGFEQIKDHYRKKYNDLLVFEKFFRLPLQFNGKTKGVNTIIDKEVEQRILSYCTKIYSGKDLDLSNPGT